MRNLPGLLFSILLALFLTQSGLATSPAPSPASEDVDDLLDYLTGSYRIIGKELDSDKPFLGRVVISRQGKQLQVLRTVNGITTAGVGRIEVVPLASSRVLRIRVNSGNYKFEVAYLFHSDLYNYALIDA